MWQSETSFWIYCRLCRLLCPATVGTPGFKSRHHIQGLSQLSKSLGQNSISWIEEQTSRASCFEVFLRFHRQWSPCYLRCRWMLHKLHRADKAWRFTEQQFTHTIHQLWKLCKLKTVEDLWPMLCFLELLWVTVNLRPCAWLPLQEQLQPPVDDRATITACHHCHSHRAAFLKTD